MPGGEWEPVCPAPALGAVCPIAFAEREWVVWRGASGALAAIPRACPHLDHDLADGHVAGDELVCPGHGWSFTPDGRALKRNEFGRADPKGRVHTLVLRAAGNAIEARAVR